MEMETHQEIIFFIYDLIEIIKTICEKKISTNANVSTNKEINVMEIFTVLKEKLFIN